jgi:hypothetical protein
MIAMRLFLLLCSGTASVFLSDCKVCSACTNPAVVKCCVTSSVHAYHVLSRLHIYLNGGQSMPMAALRWLSAGGVTHR